MTLNFPDSPSTGDIYNDSTSGFQYEWNGTVWISTDPQRAANIKELDDISSGFNGSTTQFNLRVSSSAVEPVSDSQLLISVGGVMQNPTNDYTVSGSTITFTTAPSAGLTFFGTFLGQALSLNTVQDGTVEFASFKTGTAGVGIKSDGTAIGVGITQIDFVGSGNTVVSVGNTVSVYIAAGIDTTGTSKFNNIITTGNVTGNLNVTGIVTATTLHGTLATAAQTNITSVGTLSALTATSLTAATGVTTNATNTQLVVTGISTYTGAIDANGGANIAGGLVANSAQVSDLTSGRVTYAGGSGELQDSGNLTFSGSELTASSATVSDLTDNRVVIAGSSGALEDSSNLTFDGSTLTVNGDVSVAGTITYQEVSEIDAVGFVTARKGVRVTNGGIIVTAGLSTFSDDVKLAGANYDITYDRSADSVIFNDNAKAIFGTGSDLKIYHDASHSYIQDAGTGNLYLRTNGAGVVIDDGSNTFARFLNGNACDFNFNGTKRLETTSVGINVVGNVDCDSLNNAGISTFGGAVTAGAVTVTGDLFFDNGSDAGKDLRWDVSADALHFSDSVYAIFGSDSDANLLHNGSDFYITNTTGNLNIRPKASELGIVCVPDGAVSLYHDNSVKLATASAGISVTGNIDLTSELNFAGTPAHKYIDFYTKASGGTNYNAALRLVNHDSSDFDDAVVMEREGEVKLYHSGSEKLNTTATGIEVTGSIVDSKGDLRRVPANTQSGGSAYTLVAADSGKLIARSGGSVTIPNSVFTTGDMVTILNNSGSDITLTASVSTLYNTADASTGNRTLAGRGMATVYFTGATSAYISGSGLS